MANKKPPKKPDVMVTPQGDQWAVKRKGAKRASSLHNTQEQAKEKGKQTAQREKAELEIRNREGEVRDRISYGNDPKRSKG
jgi:hypothetical protein